MDNFTAQTEELEALKAIYEGDMKVGEENGSHCVTIKTGDSGLFAQFEFMFPDDYPSQSPPVYEIKCILLTVDDVREISTALETMYSKEEVVLYQWIEWIREYLETKAPRTIPGTEKLASMAQTTESISPGARDIPHENTTQESNSHALIYLDPPEWIHGEPITDRRSTFQAHAAVVQTTDEVEVGLTLLKRNKKIASATHNILAYRLQDSKKRALVQDCDDDGETAAGGRLLHLLQIMDVMNVMVVVTRWYGGVQLGPDRFKHINNTARILLQETKMGKDGANGSGKKKSKSSRNKK